MVLRKDGKDTVLLDVPALDGVVAGEDWLVAWGLYGYRLAITLIVGDHREELVVTSTVDNSPTVNAPTVVDGVFSSIVVAVQSGSVTPSVTWQHGQRLTAMCCSTGQRVEG